MYLLAALLIHFQSKGVMPHDANYAAAGPLDSAYADSGRSIRAKHYCRWRSEWISLPVAVTTRASL
jgi:hypothetical protein